MTLNTTYYLQEIEEFAKEYNYAMSFTHVFGYPVDGQSLLTLNHYREEQTFSFVLITTLKEKPLYRCVYKNVITYTL